MSPQKSTRGPRKGQPIPRYDDTFKREAVRQLESGKTLEAVSNSTGVHSNSLRTWREKFGSGAPVRRRRRGRPPLSAKPTVIATAPRPVMATASTSSDEVAQLKRQVQELKIERDLFRNELLRVVRG